MAKAKRRESSRRSERKSKLTLVVNDNKANHYESKKLKPKNKEQEKAINLIKNQSIVGLFGQVGSGKTFLAAATAVELVKDIKSPYERIVLVRPNIDLGKDLGSLPGSLYEKLQPYLQPIIDGIIHQIGEPGLKHMVNSKSIEYLAVQHMRGRTWNNCIVIIDETQNLTRKEVAVALTRKGLDCKIIFTGDLKQTDMKRDSGIQLLYEIVEKYENTPHVLLELEESVRSAEVQWYASVFEQLQVEY